MIQLFFGMKQGLNHLFGRRSISYSRVANVLEYADFPTFSRLLAEPFNVKNLIIIKLLVLQAAV